MNTTIAISPKVNRKVVRSYDKHVYKNRNIIEKLFSRLNQLQRIASRYDKLDIRFEAFISNVGALIWFV